jgi:hypothetical protein
MPHRLPVSSLIIDEIERRRIANLLEPLIDLHRNEITADTPTRDFPSRNVIRVSEAGSFVWTSTSHTNAESNLEHTIGFIGSEYIGRLGEGILRFFMTYGEGESALSFPSPWIKGLSLTSSLTTLGRNGHAARVGELLVPDIYTLQSCGFGAGGNYSWTKIRRLITEEMILTLLKRSVETKRRIVLVIVPVDESIAQFSENKTLRVGQWILAAKFLPIAMSNGRRSERWGRWDAHAMVAEAALYVRTFDERVVPYPPIREDIFFSGNRDDEIAECMRKSLETLRNNRFL